MRSGTAPGSPGACCSPARVASSPRAECWRTDDAEIVLVGYGIVGRILKAVVEIARASGIRAGLLRPITLYPFPVEQIRAAARQAKAFVTVELSNGQMVDDVRLALAATVQRLAHRLGE